VPPPKLVDTSRRPMRRRLQQLSLLALSHLCCHPKRIDPLGQTFRPEPEALQGRWPPAWTVMQPQGGTSCPHAWTESNRPKPIGRRRASIACPGTANSSRFLSRNPSLSDIPEPPHQPRTRWNLATPHCRRARCPKSSRDACQAPTRARSGRAGGHGRGGCGCQTAMLRPLGL
jgi:hypothetical protein